MKNKIRAAFVTLLLAAGLTVAVAEPAYAAWGGCNALPMRVCTYLNDGGTGAVYYYTGPIGTCIDIGAPFDEQISSVWNRFAHHRIRLFLWSDSCQGLWATVYPGNRESYGGTPYNDSFNSLYIIHEDDA